MHDLCNQFCPRSSAAYNCKHGLQPTTPCGDHATTETDLTIKLTPEILVCNAGARLSVWLTFCQNATLLPSLYRLHMSISAAAQYHVAF